MCGDLADYRLQAARASQLGGLDSVKAMVPATCQATLLLQARDSLQIRGLDFVAESLFDTGQHSSVERAGCHQLLCTLTVQTSSHRSAWNEISASYCLPNSPATVTLQYEQAWPCSLSKQPQSTFTCS